MFLVGMLSWWYGKGLITRVQIIKKRLRSVADVFSVDLLIRTLFNPFRQISADASGNSFPDKVRAFFDKLLSRVIGFIVRSFMVIFGSVVILIQVIFGLIILLFWLAVPILPIVGFILMSIGWMYNG